MQSFRTLAVFVTISFAVSLADDVCVPPERNTLSSSCYGACSSSLCVSYAPLTAEDGSKSNTDGSFFYKGCSTANIPTCKTKVTSGKCEVQCLVNTPAIWSNQQWTLSIAQPQSDKADTAVFQNIDDLTLPSTLQNLYVDLNGPTCSTCQHFDAGCVYFCNLQDNRGCYYELAGHYPAHFFVERFSQRHVAAANVRIR